jgi:4-methyl-5(b-hydroxyethyl)-thiazole monophosphate biosynthesis
MPVAVVFLAEGFEDIEAVTVIDVLRRGGVDVTTVAVGGSLGVKSAHGIEMRADRLLESLGEGVWDAVILPGGMPGTENLSKSPGVIEILKRHAEAGRLICAICAAPMILGKRGILKGKNATCFPGCEDGMGDANMIPDVPCVRDGNLVTGASAGCAIPFGLALIAALKGQAAADAIAAQIVIR